MLRFTDDQRRARLGIRHHLTLRNRTNNVVELAGDLVGLHATDPATVFLSTAARSADPAGSVLRLEHALYEERTLVRTLGMRRTMFVVPTADVPLIQAACTDALVPGERRRLVTLIEGAGIAVNGTKWLAKVEAATLAALESRGEATAAQLGTDVAELRHKIAVGQGKKWAGSVGMSTRVLFLLSTAQLVARGRPNGSWTSSQYRWSPMSTWLPDGFKSLPAPEARAELARRWLGTYGPATTEDLRWWTGWSITQTRIALAAMEAVPVMLDDGEGWIDPGDDSTAAKPGPWVALLPALDPTIMGWQRRNWYLGPHREQLFDRNGNAGPTIWVDGRVVGGWSHRADGEVVYRLLEAPAASVVKRIDRAAAEMSERLGPLRISSRFPTPLDRQLRA